jgi:hypothetical protein
MNAMSLKHVFITADIFKTDDPFPGIDFNHSVNQEKGIRMRKNFI